MSKDLLLNCLIPFDVNQPSPSLSILKSFMETKGYKVEIIYWNIILKDIITRHVGMYCDNLKNEVMYLMPFFYMLSKYYHDKKKIERLKVFWLNNTNFIDSLDIDFETVFNELGIDITNKINEELESRKAINYQLIGFSSKFDQWIPSCVFSKIFKGFFPSTKIIMGGFGNKNEAETMIKINPDFDFVTWGEGEFTLLELCKEIERDTPNFNDVPRLVYRKSNKVLISDKKGSYVDLKEKLIPNFSDYFNSIIGCVNKREIVIPLETSRGCHWNRCMYCFLNKGYRYRVKSISHVIDEIKYYNETYDIYRFEFIDNDLVGTELDVFDRLLDSMIDLNLQLDNIIKIHFAEICPKGLTKEHFKKMTLAGFTGFQAGVESTSDSILKKMNKNNTVADNINIMKWGTHFKMDVFCNIITGLINCTDDEIIESFHNLKILRFYFKQLEIETPQLAINSSSKYFKMIPKEKLDNWSNNIFFSLLPTSFINQESEFVLFSSASSSINNLWPHLIKRLNDYKMQKYEYKIISNNGNVFYEEYLNGLIVNSLSFDEHGYFEILQLTNNQVSSIDCINDEILDLGINIPKELLKERITELMAEGLLYHNIDYSEIISIINTDTIIKL